MGKKEANLLAKLSKEEYLYTTILGLPVYVSPKIRGFKQSNYKGETFVIQRQYWDKEQPIKIFIDSPSILLNSNEMHNLYRHIRLQVVMLEIMHREKELKRKLNEEVRQAIEEFNRLP